MNKICVIGLGYIGLPTAAMFATQGFEVLGVDINDIVVQTLNQGDIHIQEPGLRTLVQAALKSNQLKVAKNPEFADTFIIAVPTPVNKANDSLFPRANLAYVVAAAKSIVPYLRPGNLVILESTVPPRTTIDVLLPILLQSGILSSQIFVAHSPERVLPGHILQELVGNDRVIGGVTPTAAEMAKSLYASFVEGDIFLTEATTAETAKLMENTYRDVNIALANEFSVVAEEIGINIWEAIKLANHHPRVNILKPGPGVGGHCIAVDPWFIVEAAPEVTPLIQTARQVNDSMPGHIVELVKQKVTDIKYPVITCLGLTYKANVDDIRESPALEVVRLLQAEGFTIRVYDPYVSTKIIAGQLYSLEAALKEADVIIILTDHEEFKQMNPKLLDILSSKIVIDTRNILSSGLS